MQVFCFTEFFIFFTSFVKSFGWTAFFALVLLPGLKQLLLHLQMGVNLLYVILYVSLSSAVVKQILIILTQHVLLLEQHCEARRPLLALELFSLSSLLALLL